jgi:hypothetical protein
VESREANCACSSLLVDSGNVAWYADSIPAIRCERVAYIRSGADGPALACLNIHDNVAVAIRDRGITTISRIFPVRPTDVAVAVACCPFISNPAWCPAIFMEPSGFTIVGVVLEDALATAIGFIGRDDIRLGYQCGEDESDADSEQEMVSFQCQYSRKGCVVRVVSLSCWQGLR